MSMPDISVYIDTPACRGIHDQTLLLQSLLNAWLLAFPQSLSLPFSLSFRLSCSSSLSLSDASLGLFSSSIDYGAVSSFSSVSGAS